MTDNVIQLPRRDDTAELADAIIKVAAEALNILDDIGGRFSV
jgi:hypothetical protein